MQNEFVYMIRPPRSWKLHSIVSLGQTWTVKRFDQSNRFLNPTERKSSQPEESSTGFKLSTWSADIIYCVPKVVRFGVSEPDVKCTRPSTALNRQLQQLGEEGRTGVHGIVSWMSFWPIWQYDADVIVDSGLWPNSKFLQANDGYHYLYLFFDALLRKLRTLRISDFPELRYSTSVLALITGFGCQAVGHKRAGHSLVLVHLTSPSSWPCF